jgi:tetratricopeptide (TPR) repeat protein
MPLTAPFLLPHGLMYHARMRGISLFIFGFIALCSPALAQEADPAPAEAPAAVEEEARKPSEIRAEQLDVLFGRLYTSKGNGTEGIEQKIWALWSASDSPTAEVLLQQAERAMDDGAPAESLSILDRLIGSFPDFAEAWNKRATLYYLMKKDDASLSDIQHVLDLEPRHFGALAGKGMILKRQKKYSEAMTAFREALAINSGMEAVKSAISEIERLEQGI